LPGRRLAQCRAMASRPVQCPAFGAPDWYEELVDLGYTDLWSAESDGQMRSPSSVGRSVTPQLRLGTAIVPVYTRGPATLAMSVASMAEAAPGRFVLGWELLRRSSSHVGMRSGSISLISAPATRCVSCERRCGASGSTRNSRRSMCADSDFPTAGRGAADPGGCTATRDAAPRRPRR